MSKLYHFATVSMVEEQLIFSKAEWIIIVDESAVLTIKLTGNSTEDMPRLRSAIKAASFI